MRFVGSILLVGCGGAPIVSVTQFALEAPTRAVWEDDRYVLVVTGQRLVRLDVSSGEELELYVGATDAVSLPVLEGAVALNTNGDLVRIDSNGQDTVLVAGVGEIRDLVASEDGLVLAWRAADGKVRVYDAPLSTETTYEVDGAPLLGTPWAVSDDRTQVLAANEDGTRWWLLDPGTEDAVETQPSASPDVVGAVVLRGRPTLGAVDADGKRFLLEEQEEVLVDARLEGDLVRWGGVSPDGTAALTFEEVRCKDDACATAKMALVRYAAEEEKRVVLGRSEVGGLDGVLEQRGAVSPDEQRLALVSDSALWIVGLADEVSGE